MQSRTSQPAAGVVVDQVASSPLATTSSRDCCSASRSTSRASSTGVITRNLLLGPGHRKRRVPMVDFDLAVDDDHRRLAVREWLAAHPKPGWRAIAEAGYVVPHWPPPYGLDADPVHQLIIDEELSRARVARPSNPIGIGWAAPTILMAGTEAQKHRYLWPALAGEEIWCQLFSEPEAGSDLASLSTRAERDGDEWVINGSKIWTSGAHLSKFGILLARTNPDAPKRKGISYFICPMDTPGISMSPIPDMTGAHSFNQVFFS